LQEGDRDVSIVWELMFFGVLQTFKVDIGMSQLAVWELMYHTFRKRLARALPMSMMVIHWSHYTTEYLDVGPSFSSDVHVDIFYLPQTIWNHHKYIPAGVPLAQGMISSNK
jgi:hypothetical protein